MLEPSRLNYILSLEDGNVIRLEEDAGPRLTRGRFSRSQQGGVARVLNGLLANGPALLFLLAW